ncbi:DEAD-box ATP-dependent RNA helicase 17-like isoform X1 [Salvia splendens]|uniref:DEAD-box ATP-dependent RNA helicase 17-like isoform X1 n=1 Tax=Salvia splendens TaxID=180675 RepID=UPI001C25C80B|nr:DEAD-box ATP-dependent RNA helicase 17-like isoform X1 [Salvia splendens]
MELDAKITGKKAKSESKNSSELFASCSFSDLGLHPALCDQLKERLGFEAPTLVQAQAIPVVLSGRHVLVNAATGTGKTVAYLAPIIHMLQSYDERIERADGTFALVLVPTRELCMQVYEILQKLLHRFHWIVPGYIMGGENRGKEKARLRKGVTILVATAGRLLDHLKNTSSFVHKNLRWIIFDEADRILELGYGKDIEEILGCLGTGNLKSGSKDISAVNSGVQKQNLLLSATLNDKVNHLANVSLENPVMIGLDDNMSGSRTRNVSLESNGVDIVKESRKTLDTSNEEYKLPTQLVQKYIKVPCGSRLVVLLSVLKHLYETGASQKVVVFFSTCDAVDFHYSLLGEFKWTALQKKTEVSQKFLGCKMLRLHGNMNQEDRKTTFQSFKTDRSALLFSTDVSARGLDFPKVRFIIQYDSPGEATEYVHRVGRTARLGEKGDSLLFLQPTETDYLKDLEKHGVMLTEYPLLKLLSSFPVYNMKQPACRFVSIEMHPLLIALQRALEAFVVTEPKISKLAKEAFSSWVRAYTAHRGELKQIFMVKKLHLGHVAKSFALKDQPTLVNKSIQKQLKKRKRNDQRNDKQKVKSKKRAIVKS